MEGRGLDFVRFIRLKTTQFKVSRVSSAIAYHPYLDLPVTFKLEVLREHPGAPSKKRSAR